MTPPFSPASFKIVVTTTASADAAGAVTPDVFAQLVTDAVLGAVPDDERDLVEVSCCSGHGCGGRGGCGGGGGVVVVVAGVRGMTRHEASLASAPVQISDFRR